jgi:hypothetical protein
MLLMGLKLDSRQFLNAGTDSNCDFNTVDYACDAGRFGEVSLM